MKPDSSNKYGLRLFKLLWEALGFIHETLRFMHTNRHTVCNRQDRLRLDRCVHAPADIKIVNNHH